MERWGQQQGLSFGGTEVNLVCDITSAAATDRIFSFSFSKPVTLLAFESDFHVLHVSQR